MRRGANQWLKSVFSRRAEIQDAVEVAMWRPDQGITMSIDERSEVYCVRDAVWKEAGMEPLGGCLCIGCLEKRLSRKLKRKDFKRGHPLNEPVVPGTPRLIERRGQPILEIRVLDRRPRSAEESASIH